MYEKKLDIKISPIPRKKCISLIKKLHYSKTIPNSTKYFIGVFIDGNLVGAVTLGYGTSPKHTIKKLFPSLSPKDYLEIGRMCIHDKYKTNTESQVLSKLIKWLKKELPHVKILFTWADGVLGKAGYVYQASNFLYGGFIETEVYLHNGIRIHMRAIKRLIAPNDSRYTVRPTPQQLKDFGIVHIKGKQFRYIYFLCGFSEKKQLLEESPINWTRNYPKKEDCTWKKWIAPYKFVPCDQPIISSYNFKEVETLDQTTLDRIL